VTPCAPAPCLVDACNGTVRSRGLCNKHLLREKRHGSPTGGGAERFRSEDDRLAELWRRIHKESGDGCWIYDGPLNQGYGYFFYSGMVWRVHRLTYTLSTGPIAMGYDLDHLCHTRDDSCEGGSTCPHRACCNPQHLETVTRQENTQRGIRARRPLCRNGHPYDMEIHRRGGVERRCSTCERAKRRQRTLRDRRATV
jgi:hypothetical protein